MDAVLMVDQVLQYEIDGRSNVGVLERTDLDDLRRRYFGVVDAEQDRFIKGESRLMERRPEEQHADLLRCVQQHQQSMAEHDISLRPKEPQSGSLSALQRVDDRSRTR